MPIFINYRRDDSQAITGRIDDHLRHAFGDEDVFLDIDSIPLGTDFTKHIRDSLSQCEICLAIIGRRWVSDRLEDENDFVRLELEEALRLEIPLIPVLVEGATIPKRAEVPPTLIRLLTRQAIEVDSGRDFKVHVARLIDGIKEIRARAASMSTLGPRVRSGKPQDRVEAVDAQGFYTADGLVRLIQERYGETPKAPFLLFRTSKQHTWIAATNAHVYCLLDDARTRVSDRTIQWQIPLARAHPIRAYTTAKGNSVVDIGEKSRWLYSSRLHPNATELEQSLLSLIRQESPKPGAA